VHFTTIQLWWTPLSCLFPLLYITMLVPKSLTRHVVLLELDVIEMQSQISFVCENSLFSSVVNQCVPVCTPLLQHCIYGSHASLKVLGFFPSICKALKVLKNRVGAWKSLNLSF